MLGLHALFPVLDVVVAATLSAWFLAFLTTRSTERATYWMRERAERVRMGALIISTGMLVDLTSLVIYLVGFEGTADAVSLFAYPCWIAGATALASATWPSAAPAPAGIESEA